jgi:glycosyltransferase involved in cell wall biosynthesis
MIRVIFCTDGIFPLEVGGMQRHSALLIDALAKLPEIELIVIHPHDQKLFAHLPSVTEISVSPVNKQKFYLLECYKYSSRVADILEQHPDHIIYSQGLSVWNRIRKFRKRLIINPHGLEPYQALEKKEHYKLLPFRLVFDHLFRNAAAVVSLGGKLSDILRSRPGMNVSRVVELPNAVNLPSLKDRSFDHSPLKLLFVARFAHNKGIHILVDAIEKLNAEGMQDKLQFILGGKGPLFGYYSEQKKLENVQYLGFVTDEQLAELYSDCDLFVFPTLFEGMPTVVLEAMSYGMPVIVSDVGATAMQIRSDNGFLIPRNDTAALCRAIRQFMNMTSEQRRSFSINARRHIENNFTWERVALQHLELFRTINPAR